MTVAWPGCVFLRCAFRCARSFSTSIREFPCFGILAQTDNKVKKVNQVNCFLLDNERQKSRAGYVSGGEQQMVAIVRAMMACPALVLLDEPSMGFAPLNLPGEQYVHAPIGSERGNDLEDLLRGHLQEPAFFAGREGRSRPFSSLCRSVSSGRRDDDQDHEFSNLLQLTVNHIQISQRRSATIRSSTGKSIKGMITPWRQSAEAGTHCCGNGRRGERHREGRPMAVAGLVATTSPIRRYRRAGLELDLFLVMTKCPSRSQ
ncbi:ATP-binding cassette domain-containing protein (plasmid) [Paraburkholderia pallida]|uniref:ATP-binding cassette domain-containing protein n=1 Tax=Paraburkholderia pallida TaxID=2547399 RepID=A0A4P7D642_9BURK|nr:ATP-binding cassette domain-containing protein [Paraburkholderia pallida]